MQNQQRLKRLRRKFNLSKPKDSARERAISLLARREHSYQELVQKLTHKGFAKDEIIESLEALVEKGWQSDFRFTESWIRHRIQSGHGPIKIRIELSQKGIAHSTIEQGFETIESDWVELARQVWTKKFRVLPADWPEKAKQIRFLMYRGFSSEQIEAVFQLEEQNTG